MIPYTEHELNLVLEEIYRGDKIVIPSSIEHAEFMIQVAQNYIDNQHKKTFNALKADHGN